jgi:ABC-type Zn uptake system ZnuABC Zn-binding protein ZnuA
MRYLFILSLAAAMGLAQAADRKPLVVASTTQIADFARQIAGDRMTVYGILKPGADPHVYEPTPRDAEIVQKADLLLQNGLHLEGKNWMANLAKDAGKPVISCTDGLKPLILEEDGEKVEDPHAWFDPAHAATYIRNITAGLVKVDPARQVEYEARATLYLHQLQGLDAWIKQQVNRVPAERRILVTSHDAFNYFCAAYGFKNEAPAGWSTEGQITPAARKQVVESISSFGVPAIFVETSVNPKILQEIAREAGVRIGGTLYSDSMGEAGSAGESYIGMMRENTLLIVEALGQ